METQIVEKIESILGNSETTIARDLKLNLKRLLGEGALDLHDKLFTVLAAATSVEHRGLMDFAKLNLAEAGVPPEQIQEAQESAAIMAMLNTYYRFKHMVGKDEDYRTAGLRMTALARPVLGKERFEMLAFGVSVLNGCETCIASHEKVLRDGGMSIDKIHDVARIVAVVKALKVLTL